MSDNRETNILEYARAIKKYCEKHRNEHNFYMCDSCKYAPSERAAYAYTYGEKNKCPFNVPAYWNLPEPYKPEKGKWITDKERLGYWLSTCSECKHIFHGNELLIYKPNFCPNCGADMRGGKE